MDSRSRVNVAISPALHHALKVLSAFEGQAITDAATMAIQAYVDSRRVALGIDAELLKMPSSRGA